MSGIAPGAFHERVKPGWPVAPEILEEVYNVQDALAFGGALISLLNHADRVKVACLAQLVNAIAPILTETGGPAWRQTIFYPFAQTEPLRARHGAAHGGRSPPPIASRYMDPRGKVEHWFDIPAAPYIKLAAVHDEQANGLSLFVLNRHLQERITLDVMVRGIAGCVGRSRAAARWRPECSQQQAATRSGEALCASGNRAARWLRQADA